MDIALWCTLSTQAWKESERTAWEEIPARLRSRGLLVATHRDLLSDATDVEKLLDRLRDEAGPSFRDVLPMSTVQALTVARDDHAGQAEVRRATTIPIASGECEFTRFDFQDLLERRALDIAQPDVARSGGMTEIRRIAALTSAHGVRLAPHAWGSGVLFAASMHVAMSAPNCHILEVTQGYMPMMWELFNEPFDIRPDGTVHAPDRPGLGFTLRADALDRFRYVDGPEFEF